MKHEIIIDGEKVQVSADDYMAILAIVTEPGAQETSDNAIPPKPKGEGWYLRQDRAGAWDWVHLLHTVPRDCITKGCTNPVSDELHAGSYCKACGNHQFDLVGTH